MLFRSSGFVFCCFNNNYKDTPEIFAVWMRLLAQVPGSVLWLLGATHWAEENLRREAQHSGIAPERLIFAPRTSFADHLARHRHADLFLDTVPVNAHTTASDALWAGVPLVTCAGRSMASRVAGSLLSAAGLPELVTYDLVSYERLALQLARSPERLAALQAALARTRAEGPLFDAARKTRQIEAAFTRMWEIACRGEAPRSFAVD